VSDVPALIVALHEAPQLIAAGVDVTVPEPDFATVRVYCGVNVAVTVVFALTVTEQVPVPVQPPPDQPVNAYPDAGAALSVSDVPALTVALHEAPQLIAAGVDVTVPEPDFVTVSVYCAVNVALTARACVIETVHVLVPLHAPPHPVNT